MTTTRVYDLYPNLGSFSCKTVDYHGVEHTVAATSIRQAYAVAHKDIWINPADEHPVGIVSIYRRDTGTTLPRTRCHINPRRGPDQSPLVSSCAGAGLAGASRLNLTIRSSRREKNASTP